jgi:hypothetical protein
MTQNTDSTLLKQTYGGGIHLYSNGILHEGWWIVPVDWDGGSYTISCFDPRGTRYPNWNHYPSIENATAAGKEFVVQKITELSSSQFNLT